MKVEERIKGLINYSYDGMSDDDISSVKHDLNKILLFIRKLNVEFKEKQFLINAHHGVNAAYEVELKKIKEAGLKGNIPLIILDEIEELQAELEKKNKALKLIAEESIGCLGDGKKVDSCDYMQEIAKQALEGR